MQTLLNALNDSASRRFRARALGFAVPWICGIFAVISCGERAEPPIPSQVQALTGSSGFHASPDPCALGAGETSCQTTVHWPSDYPPNGWSNVLLWREDAGGASEEIGCYPAADWGSVVVDVEASGSTFQLGAKGSCHPLAMGPVMFLGSLTVTPVQCQPGDEIHPQVPANVKVDEVARLFDPGCPGIDEERVRWSFSDTPLTSTGFKAPKYYGDRGGYTVTVELLDPSLTSVIESEIFNVTATFAAPELATYPDRTWATSREFSLPLELVAPTRPGNLELSVDWGDGSPVDTVSIPEETDYAPLGHVYSIPGQYTMSVTVEDDDAQSDTEAFELTSTDGPFVDLHVEFADMVLPGMKTYGRFVAHGGANQGLIDTALAQAPAWVTIIPDDPSATTVVSGTIEAAVPLGTSGGQSFTLSAGDGSLTDDATVNFTVATYSEQAVGQLITAAGGGTVEVVDPDSPIFGAKLVVPPGSLAQDETISLGTVTPAPAGSLTGPFSIVEVQPSGLEFNIPAELHIPLSDEQQYSLVALDGAEVTTYEFDPSTKTNHWVSVETTVNGVNDALIASLRHSSPYIPSFLDYFLSNKKTFIYMGYDVTYVVPSSPYENSRHAPVEGLFVPRMILDQLDAFDPAFIYDSEHSVYVQTIARVLAYSHSRFIGEFDCGHPWGNTQVQIKAIKPLGGAHAMRGLFLRPNLWGMDVGTPAHEVFHMCQFQATVPGKPIGQQAFLVALSFGDPRSDFLMESTAEAMQLEALGWDPAYGAHPFMKTPQTYLPTFTNNGWSIYNIGDKAGLLSPLGGKVLQYGWFPFFRYLTQLPATSTDPIRHYFSRSTRAIQGLGGPFTTAEDDIYDFLGSVLQPPLQTLAGFALHFQVTRDPDAIPGIDDWYTQSPGAPKYLTGVEFEANPAVFYSPTVNLEGRGSSWHFLKAGAAAAMSLDLPSAGAIAAELGSTHLVFRVEADYRSATESVTAFLYEYDTTTSPPGVELVQSFLVKEDPTESDLIEIPLCDIYDCESPGSPQHDYALAIVNDPFNGPTNITPAQVKLEAYFKEAPQAESSTWLYFGSKGSQSSSIPRSVYRASLDEEGAPAEAPVELYDTGYAGGSPISQLAIDPHSDRRHVYWGGLGAGRSSARHLFRGFMDGEGASSEFYTFSDWSEDGRYVADLKVSSVPCDFTEDEIPDVWIYWSVNGGGFTSAAVYRKCSDGGGEGQILASWRNGTSGWVCPGGLKCLGVGPTPLVLTAESMYVVSRGDYLIEAPLEGVDIGEPGGGDAAFLEVNFNDFPSWAGNSYASDIAYNPVEDAIYIADAWGNRIYRYQLGSGEVTELLDEASHGVANPSQLAIDVDEQLLYWTQSGNGTTPFRGISRVNLDGTGATSVLSWPSPDGAYGVAVCTDCDDPPPAAAPIRRLFGVSTP